MNEKEEGIVFHKGIFKKTATTTEAVFMITGLTIGAGILGLPYAIARPGLGIGLLYIIVIGLAILFLNIMLGEVVARTKESLQLPGLAKKYVGVWAGNTMTVLIVLSSYGALLAYIVGEGESLASLFGGTSRWWSLVFWVVGSGIVYLGLGVAKRFQKIVSAGVVLLLVCISLYTTPHITSEHIFFLNIDQLFFPYGVVLFALYNAPALAEAHALLPGKPLQFRRALIYGSLIPIGVYCLFVVAVVGTSGVYTHEVATTGLGVLFGRPLEIVGNIIAVCAMGTGFVGISTALKQTFVWDNKLRPGQAYLLVVGVPFVLFILGIKNFIFILHIVGSLFISIQALIMMLVYYKAHKHRVLSPSPYKVHRAWIFICILTLLFASMSMISFFDIFKKLL